MDVGQAHAQLYMGRAMRPAMRLQLRKGTNYLFVLPMLIFIVVMLGYPIFVNVQTSLHDVTVTTFRSGNAPFVGLDNYRKIFQDEAFLKSLSLSLAFTSLSIMLQFT